MPTNVLVQLAASVIFMIPLVTPREILWCDHVSQQTEQEEKVVTSQLPPDVTGKWVSESCEVRPGPEFVVRNYQFNVRHSTILFHLQQFYYGDPSCMLPLYVINAWGLVNWTQSSWLVVGAQDADYSLSRVTVLAYGVETASALSSRVNDTCPGWVRRPWRAYRPYVLWSDETEDDCLAGLHLVFHELQLIRVEKRPLPRHPRAPGVRTELFLGDIHTRIDERAQYRPTSYQLPLIRSTEITGCYICRLVARSDELSPPQLHITPHLPIHLNGEWLSRRCESRPYGTFILRRVRFVEHSWQGVYQFHADPSCAVPIFRILASGKWENRGPSATISGAWDIDFRLSSVTLTPLDVGTVHNLNGHVYNTCGSNGSWHLGEPQDITWTHGCSGLGIKVPSVHYEVVRIIIDAYGNSLLQIGVPDSELRRYTADERPTAFQASLVQCTEREESTENLNNDVGVMSNAIYSENSGSLALGKIYVVFLVLIVING